MAPKRKVPAKKKQPKQLQQQQIVSSENKKQRTKSNNDKEEEDEDEHQVKETLALIANLYETCVLIKERNDGGSSNNIMEAEQQLQRALVQADDRGVLRQTVWPSLVQVFQKDANHAGAATTTSTSSLWFRLCHLTAVLLSWQCREGNVTQQTLEFIFHPSATPFAAGANKSEDETEAAAAQTTAAQHDNNKQALMACIQTLCTCPRHDLNYRTIIVHFLDVVWNATSGASNGTSGDNMLLYHVGASLQLWHWMPKHRRELELRRRPHLHQLWKKSNNQHDHDEKTQTKHHGHHHNDNEQPFIVKLLNHIIPLVEGDAFKLGQHHNNNNAGRNIYHRNNDPEDKDEQEQEEMEHQTTVLMQWIFLHRSLELLIDLLSSVQIRPYLIPFLSSIHFSITCRAALGISTFSQTDNENLFLAQQLLERIDRLQHFPVRDHIYNNNSNKGDNNDNIATAAGFTSGTGSDDTTITTALSKVDVASLYHRRATTLQKMCHRHYADALPDIVFSGVGLLCTNASYVRRVLGGFPDHDLLELLHKMRLVDKTHGGKELYSRDFLLFVLEEYLILPNDPLEDLQSSPLYPTESVLWDFARIPPGHSGLLPASHVLSLPKLHAQFLSYADYLWRNFELMRLESAYEIRSDLVDVIRRVRPLLRQTLAMDEHDNEQVALQTEFTGWARMALEMDETLKIVRVEKPLLGTNHPSKVIAEITIDLKPCGDSIRREWDALGEFDNLFLVTIDAGKMSGAIAPLLRNYHMHHGNHRQWDTDGDRRVQDEDDRTFRQRYGVMLVRGCMILQVRDQEGTVLSDPAATKDAHPKGTKRIFRVAMDPAQFSQDARSPLGSGLYQSLNLVVRRHGRENNFKAILETTRSLMAGAGSVNRVIPPWLQPLLLGQGDPAIASYTSSVVQAYAKKTVGVANPDSFLDYGDTFLDETHLRESFPGIKVVVDGKTESEEQKGGSSEQQEPVRRRSYRVRMLETDEQTTMDATSYPVAENVKGNPVRFTPRQVAAIRSGLSCGLTLVIGPPGTGKTDVAVQIISSLYHSFPTQRTVVITHSNAALNDIFQKVTARGDVNERCLVRLGSGERDLETDSTHDFTKAGRVAYSLGRRGVLLEQVQLLSEMLGLSGRAERGADGSPSYTCETAEYFRSNQLKKCIGTFHRQVKASNLASDDADVARYFPLSTFFKLEKNDKLSMSDAHKYLARIEDIFNELAEYRPLELLRSQRQRTDYLLIKQARVVAMTCTHAAIARSHLMELDFQYDNLVIEEAGQMTEIETFIPLLLQRGEADDSLSSGLSRLKRVCLMGDHNQLPPVIKNQSFARYSNLDQSMFSRLIRLGAPYIQLDKQGRARSELANLYRWRYDNLGDLNHVLSLEKFRFANPGFVHAFQIINVDTFQGKGEITPTAYFYQNHGEAEYVVALFMYMVLIGYSPSTISILTTYNGQKALIMDILSSRCGEGTPLAGIRPKAVSTVDQFQGQQNDYILLSLVRTESIGHLRDVRRLVVAVSRARLGLYVFCRQALFASSHDLKPTMEQFATNSRPNRLALVLGETFPCDRKADESAPPDKLLQVENVEQFGALVHQMQEDFIQAQAM